jgi:regulator of replication initiation timing
MLRKSTTFTILKPLERGEIPAISVLIFEIKSLDAENQGLRTENARLRRLLEQTDYYQKLVV